MTRLRDSSTEAVYCLSLLVRLVKIDQLSAVEKWQHPANSYVQVSPRFHMTTQFGWYAAYESAVLETDWTKIER